MLRSVHVCLSVGLGRWLGLLLPGELPVVRQAACYCRTVVGPPFVVVTQSHFALFKNSSSK